MEYLKSIGGAFSGVYGATREAMTTYNKQMKEDPEVSRNRTLGLTLGLTVIAATGSLFAAREGSLSAAFFTPMTLLCAQESFLIYSLQLDGSDESIKTMSKDQERIIRYALVAQTFFGAMGTMAYFDGVSRFMIPKFAPGKLAALFSLLSLGAGAALWHEQGVKAHFNES